MEKKNPLIDSNSKNNEVDATLNKVNKTIEEITAIKNDPKKLDEFLNDFDPKTLANIVKQLRPEGSLKMRDGVDERYAIVSLLHPSRQVMVNEIMLAAMGYIFQSADEYEFYLTPDEKDEIEAAHLCEHPEDRDLERVVSEHIKKKTAEDRPAIDRFLNRFFKFNPNIHVKKIGEFKIENVDVPANAFQGFEHYVAMHHTDISEIVRDKIFKHPLNIRDYIYIHDSKLKEADADTKFEALKRTTLIPIYKILEGAPVITGDEKIIRENLDLSGNDMLSRILDKQKQDKELSTHLMSNRRKLAKLENIRRHGIDDPKFKEYIHDLYPERDEQIEPFSKEELERLSEKYHAKRIEDRDKAALDAAPEGTKAIKFTEFGDPNEPVKEMVMYSEVGHYLVSDNQSDTSVAPVVSDGGGASSSS